MADTVADTVEDTVAGPESRTRSRDHALATPDELAALHVHERHSRLGLDAEDLLGMYRTILLARVLDEKIWRLNRQGKAPFAVSCQGHEGAQVGAGWAVDPTGDWVLPYYRDTALVLTLGLTAYDVLAGVFARPDDPCSGGRQMPNHWGCRRFRVVSGSSPLATHLPHAAGLALAMRMKGEASACIATLGEGSTSKGDFHEALNFAAIHRLPVVFVVENNGYAISVPLAQESAVENVAERAAGYGITGMIVDGNDPLDVYEAVHGALRRAREGDGPTLIEAKTYRYLAHTSDDDDRSYRTPEEVEAWRKKDPLTRMRHYLIEQRLLPEADEDRIDAEIRAEVEESAQRAERAAANTPNVAFTKVYARPLRPVAGAPDGASEISQPVKEGPSLDLERVPTTERNVIDAVRFTIDSLLATDERVLVLGEDVGPRGGVFKATAGMYETYGRARLLDTPIAESSIVGIGIGLAIGGMRPIAEIQFADFIHSAFDQIVSEASMLHYRSDGDFSCPLVIRAPWGGPVHGALYHSQAIEGFYAHVPGLKVVVPSTPADVSGMLREAVDDPDPVLFLEHKKSYRAVSGPVPDDPAWRVPFGVADIARHGTDISLITWGMHRHLCLEAAEQLAADDGVSVEVVDVRSLNPLDVETIISSVVRTSRALVVHEDQISFGPGAEIAALIADHAFFDLDAPVRRLATADVPAYPYAPELEAAVYVDTDQIISETRRLLAE